MTFSNEKKKSWTIKCFYTRVTKKMGYHNIVRLFFIIQLNDLNFLLMFSSSEFKPFNFIMSSLPLEI